MKTPIRILAIASVLALAGAVQAQVVIGSWQNNTGDGWIDIGTGDSIVNPAVMPSKYQFVTGVVAGYPQSLQVGRAGYGNDMKYNFTQAQILGNHIFSFTVSVPSAAASGSTGGYDQIYAVAFRASGLYTNVPWTLWTGNAGVQPNFYFYSGAAARSITVSLDYSFLLTNAAWTNSTSWDVEFTANTGGGAPAYYYMNNVTLTGTIVPTFWVDQFDPKTNADAGFTTTITNTEYDLGYITNVWSTWFASPSNPIVSWDSTMDAGGDTNMGSMKIQATYVSGQYNQWVIQDKGPGFNGLGINPPITNWWQLQTFECDVMYAPSSPTNTADNTFGRLQFGVVPPFSEDDFGTAAVPTTNGGQWYHVSLPLTNAVLTDTNLQSITSIFIKQDASAYGGLIGNATLWVDNVKFTYSTAAKPLPPPTLTIQQAEPSLRLFAATFQNPPYNRAEIISSTPNEGWIGHPGASYSYTIKNWPNPANIDQTSIFLIPDGTLPTPGTPTSYNGVDFEATNLLWFTLAPGPTNGSVVGQIVWKVNAAGANPTNTELTFTNGNTVGTWTLQFSGNSTGSVIAPDRTSYPFTIHDSTVSSDFGGGVWAFFGLQPNSAAGAGEYEDWTSISITGVAVPITTDFTAPTAAANFAANWQIMPTVTDVQLVTSATPYWLNWSTAEAAAGQGYYLATATSPLGNTDPNSPLPWVNPEYYNSFSDSVQNQIPSMGGEASMTWALLSTNYLPTVNGQPYQNGGVASKAAYFRLMSPAPTD